MTLRRVSRKQENSKMCLVCGLKNPYGLRTAFYETDDNELVAVFTPGEHHQSYPGRLHGGITAAIMDETVGRAINANRELMTWGVTIEFVTKYLKPVPLDAELKVVARITRETSRTFEGTSELILADGTVAATAHGRYLKLSLDKIADFDCAAQEWKVTRLPADPAQFEF
ncbi:MAG: PaaI family thioesterase [Vicinamibacteria bacterium]|jgi:uncharacterized protein (TIGR00369 family)|nr:PaaI family thioesterase [Vicinamibacteria bacterium]